MEPAGLRQLSTLYTERERRGGGGLEEEMMCLGGRVKGREPFLFSTAGADDLQWTLPHKY